MKCVLVIAGVLLLQMSEIQCDESSVSIECAKELGIPEDMLKGGFQRNHDKLEFRCFAPCIMKKLGILEPGNKINMVRSMELLTKNFGDKAEEMLRVRQACIDGAKNITDECDFVNAIGDCIHKKEPSY